MDLKGSLVDTHLRIYPTEVLIKFLKTIHVTKDVPTNIALIIKGENRCTVTSSDNVDTKTVQLTDKDYENLKKVKEVMNKLNPDEHNIESESKNKENDNLGEEDSKGNTKTKNDNNLEDSEETNEKEESQVKAEDEVLSDENKKFLITSDLDWLYIYIKNKRGKGEEMPHLHELLEGVDIKMPDNKIIKRNPDLEARCVKLRAQQEAREYRKMTKGVDNVRIRFPEDSISYQMKQLNRHLIAIGQFLLSIFAGFLFGFRGVEWMVGNLDFGFRLLLGVMCALIIALAEIYFLAKKLNEELSVPETVQLGGPAKFANDVNNYISNAIKPSTDKEHKD
ncbi:uncharacterized protein LOC119829664 [Zerene cesonia]|uniref:uncharacterized protein LOC119829664 n=1 Tax=Zerene cesonia TaxID=33412 RepID=UPI0018E52A2A|nr:uncharacterized protein LOC119829664 [Zerene cesonia]